jgi:hypothetical protein
MEDFLPHLYKVLYYVVYIVVASIIIFIILWIFVRLKRWYAKARIARSRKDSTTKFDYIKETNKEITGFQRFYLSQTGDVEFDFWEVLSAKPCKCKSPRISTRIFPKKSAKTE